MAGKENPYFARALANRYWKHFMGRGLVEPEDDMRVTNPPTNPELLDALAQHFIDSELRFEETGAGDLHLERLSAERGAERAQRGRSAKLLALSAAPAQRRGFP